MLDILGEGNYSQGMADFGFSTLVTLSLVLLCVVSWFAYRSSPEDRHATFLWFWGSLSLAVASASYAVRPAVPQFAEIGVFFVNFFLCLGVGLHVMGLVRIDDEDRLWWVFWIPGIVAAALGAWVLEFPWGIHVQPILVGAGLLVWIGRAVYWISSRTWGERGPAMRRVLGFYLFAALAAAVFGARVEWLPLLPGMAETPFSVDMTPSVLLFLDLSLLAIGFGELLLIYDLSALRYRREAESKLKAMVDLEDYRRLQKRLVERERDVAVGRMVAAVNHSLNSPLAAMLSASAVLGQIVHDRLPALLFPLRRLQPSDWFFMARAAGAMRPMSERRLRTREAEFSRWLRERGLPDQPYSLTGVGLDRRADLLERLTTTSDPPTVFQMLSLWADSLTARTVVDLAAQKASKLLFSLREWFETGFDSTAPVVPVATLLRGQIQALRSTYPSVLVEASLDSSSVALSPSRPLERVFAAVLENAAHALQYEGTVTVRTLDRERSVVVVIEDTGVGVPANEEHLLFEPFVGASAEGQSLGVSLYFCRLFLGEWGGSIAYRREDGASRFLIELPTS